MTITAQQRSSTVGTYPGRPLDFGATIAGAGAGCLYVGAGYGLGAGALVSAISPGAMYMQSAPLILGTVAAYIQGLAASGDQVTLQLQVNEVAVRDLLFTYDASDPAPFPGGVYCAQTFEPLIVEASQRITLYWPNSADPGEVVPGALTVFVQ